MNKRTSAFTNEHQIVKHNGIPVAVVIPYEEYQTLFAGRCDTEQEQPTIPHEVMGLVIKGKKTPIRAWREYLNLTQEEVAKRMGITQATYARMESDKVAPRAATLKRVAKSLGIEYTQLEW